MTRLVSVLAIANRVPYPPTDGGRKAMLGALRSLSDSDDIALTTLIMVDPKEPVIVRDQLAKLIGDVCWIEHDSRNRPLSFAFDWLLTNAPYSVSKYRSRRALLRASSIVSTKGVEILYLEHLSSFWIGAELKRRFPALKLVLRQHNVESLILERISTDQKSTPLRWIFRDQAQRMRQAESEAVRAADRVYSITDYDRQAFVQDFGASPDRVTTVPIGLDLHAATASDRARASEPLTALFVGPMDWRPNQMGVAWLLREILPLLSSYRNRLKIQLVGKGTDIHAHAFPGLLSASGFVDEIEPIYAQAAMAIVPLRSGSGIRVKVLDFMSRRIPVISTSVGIEGIATAADHGRLALIADEPEAFAAAILQLANDPALRRRLADAAYEQVRERYDWKQIANRMVADFLNLVSVN